MQQQRTSTVDIINDYASKTKYRIKNVERIPNPLDLRREFKVWVYIDDFENQLGIIEERLHYLIVKKRWQEQYDWSDGIRNGYGKMGITIPLVVFEYVMSRKNLINELVICVISDINRWKYTEVEPYYYYKITLKDMNDFARKRYTIFVNRWGEEVIGLPFSLFKKI